MSDPSPSRSPDTLPLPLPRAPLGVHLSPVECVEVDGHPLWLKREDRNAPALAGNKARALQFLLAGVTARTLVLTLGGVGSTHVLATARHATRLGARTWAVRWPHALNPSARAVAAAIDDSCERAPVLAAPLALLRLGGWRAGARLAGRDVRAIPFGGSAPAGIAGHVEAALELAGQVRDGLLPAPRRIVLPVGSGGTAAGLALGLAWAGLDTEVVAVRVGPRLGVTRRRILALARDTRRWLRQTAGLRLPAPAAVRLLHEYYGGAYGEPLPAGRKAARTLAALTDVGIDDSYGAKAAAAALHLAAHADGPTLFWVTHDTTTLKTTGRPLARRPFTAAIHPVPHPLP